VSDLSAKRHPELNALYVQGVVAAVVRRQTPEPGHHAERLEAQLIHAATKLTDGFVRLAKVNRGHSHETVRVSSDQLCYLVIRDKRSLGPVPGGDQPDLDTSGVHRSEREFDRQFL
jgi:hypothetical protein